IISVPVPSDFQFLPTVYSHGWSALAPFSVDRERKMLRGVAELSPARHAEFEISQTSPLRLNVKTKEPLQPQERAQLKNIVRACFRLDENLSEFYREAKKHPRY